jgi:hypothetical protein
MLYDNTTTSLSVNISVDDVLIANFTGTGGTGELIVSEINYNSDTLYNAGDWIELLNKGDAPLDISCWYVMDEREFNRYDIPMGTVIDAGERLVLIEDSIRFNNQFDEVTYAHQYIPFGMSNNGDQIRIYDYNGDEKLSVTFDDDAPWDITADGDGYTLELVSEEADPNVAGSWFAGCLQGSPGYAYSENCDSYISEGNDSDESKLIVYPNPATDYVFIQTTAGNQMLQVFNELGMLVKYVELNNTDKTDITDLSHGVYLLQVDGEDNMLNEKLIVR